MRALIITFAALISSCTHATYHLAPEIETEGRVVDSEWREIAKKKFPDEQRAVERAFKVNVQCGGKMGVDSKGRPIRGHLSLNEKVILIDCKQSVRASALTHERNHLLLKYMGFKDWQGHDNPLWPKLDLIEIKIRQNVKSKD